MRVTRRGFYRRRLPHLQRDYKPHFVTFCTYQRWILPELARDIVLECCLHDHQVTMTLHACVVMPDHVHLLLTPQQKPVSYVMNLIKGSFSHRAASSFPDWQRGFADHLILDRDHFESRRDYIHQNPVRAGLVTSSELYPYSSAYKT